MEKRNKAYVRGIKMQWAGAILFVVSQLVDYYLFVLPTASLLVLALSSMLMIGYGIVLCERKKPEVD